MRIFYCLLLHITLKDLCNASNISFIAYFDCLENDNLTTIQDVENCDVLAYVGAQIAKDVINSDENSVNYLEFNEVKLTSLTASGVSYLDVPLCFWAIKTKQ